MEYVVIKFRQSTYTNSYNHYYWTWQEILSFRTLRNCVIESVNFKIVNLVHIFYFIFISQNNPIIKCHFACNVKKCKAPNNLLVFLFLRFL